MPFRRQQKPNRRPTLDDFPVLFPDPKIDLFVLLMSGPQEGRIPLKAAPRSSKNLEMGRYDRVG